MLLGGHPICPTRYCCCKGYGSACTCFYLEITEYIAIWLLSGNQVLIYPCSMRNTTQSYSLVRTLSTPTLSHLHFFEYLLFSYYWSCWESPAIQRKEPKLGSYSSYNSTYYHVGSYVKKKCKIFLVFLPGTFPILRIARVNFLDNIMVTSQVTFCVYDTKML